MYFEGCQTGDYGSLREIKGCVFPTFEENADECLENPCIVLVSQLQ